MNKYEKLYRDITEQHIHTSNQKMQVVNKINKIKLDLMLAKFEQENLIASINKQQNLIEKIKLANYRINEQQNLFNNRKKYDIIMFLSLEMFVILTSYIAKNPFLLDMFLIAGISLASIGIDKLICFNETKNERNLISNYSINEEEDVLNKLISKHNKNEKKIKTNEDELEHQISSKNKLENIIQNLLLTKLDIIRAEKSIKTELIKKDKLTNQNINQQYDDDEAIKLILKKNKASGGFHE